MTAAMIALVSKSNAPTFYGSAELLMRDCAAEAPMAAETGRRHATGDRRRQRLTGAFILFTDFH